MVEPQKSGFVKSGSHLLHSRASRKIVEYHYVATILGIVFLMLCYNFIQFIITFTLYHNILRCGYKNRQPMERGVTSSHIILLHYFVARWCCTFTSTLLLQLCDSVALCYAWMLQVWTQLNIITKNKINKTVYPIN